MNKHSMRWISLILSVAVMIGSLTYIAAGFNAETSAGSSYIASASSSASAGIILDTDDIISTDEDRITESSQDTWVYETVLRDNGYLVNQNGSAEVVDVYLDIAASGDTSISVGEKAELVVTMENTTANDTRVDSETKETVSDAVDVKSISFSLAYDGTYFKFVSGESNIDGVSFTETGTGAGTALQISYTSDEDKPELKAHEMPCFRLSFEAIKENASGDSVTLVQIEDSTVIDPAALKVAAGEAEEYRIYSQNGNNALSGLEVSLKNDGAANTPVILNPNFDSETRDYFITVPYDTNKNDIEIDADAADAKATTEIVWENADSELAAGINRCTVNVKAADGSIQSYNIIVKKLALDTLADPQTTLRKTVKIADKGSAAVKDSYKVNYEINGVNDILAGGNDYVIYISSAQTNKLDIEAIRANTANLEDSTLTVIDMSLDRPQIITYDLSSPALEAKVEYASGTVDPEQYILSSKFTNDNKYLIMASSAVDNAAVTERTGYTEIVLPDDANMTQNLTAAGIDNTAAEFVFIVDFSSVRNNQPDQIINYGLVKALFGYDDGDASTKDIPGYIQQVKNMLSNDSTAKVTIIAVGADIGAGVAAEEWESYGVKFVSVPMNGEAVQTDTYMYDLANSVYRGQTYVIPQAGNEIWGFTPGESEQHNIWEYCESFNVRNIADSSTAYDKAVTADSDLLIAQYEAAMLEAKNLLEDANNAHLIVLTPNQAEMQSAFDSKIGSSAGINAAVIPVDSYAAQTEENAVAKSVYEELVVESEEQFNCNPAENARTFNLVDELNRQVFQLSKEEKPNLSMNSDSRALDIDNSAITNVLFDVVYYLPAIGEYELYAEYTVERWSNFNVDTETHYYPISNTVKTETDEDGTVIEDDIPTIAPSYDDEYELTVTKAVAKFDDANAVKPEESTITYVLLYTNTGVNTLTSVGITDSQIMLAGNDYKVYILESGKLSPDTSDYPLSVKFTAAGGSKGETTINSLEPGETIYVEYTITVPESTKVTTGTTRTASGEVNKVITSYVIENIATGASKEVDMTQVKLDIEFEYDKDSGGTVSTSASSTSTTQSTTTSTLPTVTTYQQPTTTTTKIIYKDDVPTGESSVGYIVAMSLLFGALGVFGVTIYGIVLDKKIERAASTSGNGRIRLR